MKAIQKAKEDFESFDERDALIEQANKKFIEKDLDFLGSMGVEDKLQDGVKETIKYLKDSGIGIWILTGDKVSTALNVSIDAHIVDENT